MALLSFCLDVLTVLLSAAGTRMRFARIPHVVPYYRVGPDTFRFFNVWDGMEDVTMTMAEFGGEHLLGGSVRLFYWE